MRGFRMSVLSVLMLLLLNSGVFAAGAPCPVSGGAKPVRWLVEGARKGPEPATGTSARVADQIIVQCDPDGGFDLIDRAFYIPTYEADHLQRVVLRMTAYQDGEYVFTLTAREGAFDGPLVGIATAKVPMVNQAPQDIPFEFFSAPTHRGTILTFQIAPASGPNAAVLFDCGPCDYEPTCDLCGGQIVQTEDATPPLSTFRRNSVGAAVYAPPCAVTCEADVPQRGTTGTLETFRATALAQDCTGGWSFEWDFGDGTEHGWGSPVDHAYAAPGVYQWTFTASLGGASCSKTGTLRVGDMLFASPQGTRADCSQASPCSLATALSQAQAGDTVVLAGGTYTGTGPEVGRIERTVALLGRWDGAPTGPPNIHPDNPPSLLDGEDVRRVVATAPGTFPFFEGVTFSRGRDAEKGAGILADGASLSMADCRVSDCFSSRDTGNTYGGGIYLTGGSLLLKDCTVRDNTASCNSCPDTEGGGLFVKDATEVRLQGCRFEHNYGWNGGGVYVENSPFSMEGGGFANNGSGYGGGLRVVGSTGVIRETLFLANAGGNDGGAISMLNGTLELSESALRMNTSYRVPAIIAYDSSLKMTNCVVADNRPGQAGVGSLSLTQCQSTFLHNTLARNLGEAGGDGVHIYGGTATLVNNIVAAQTTGLYVDGAGPVTADHTLWGSGGWANGTDLSGPGSPVMTADLHGDPLFSDPANGDFRLCVGSAAQDAGINAGVTRDMDLGPRPMGAGYDIGADEIPVGVALVATGTAESYSGTAPFDAGFLGAYEGGAPQYTFDWDFGDGSLHSTEFSPRHTYSTPGTFQAVFTVRDGFGAIATCPPLTITVVSPCSLDCTATVPASARTSESVPFLADATPSGCATAPAFAWTFGDGGSSSDQNPAHAYASAGTFDWTLTVAADGVTCMRTGSIAVTPGLPGDCNGDGAVSIGEVQRAINMFLGLEPVACGADCNGDGTVSIGEVQKVFNAFLGVASSC